MENPYSSGAGESRIRDPKQVRNTRLFRVIVIVFALYALLGNGAFYMRVFATPMLLASDAGARALFPYALTFALLTLLGMVLIALTFSYTFHRETIKAVAGVSAVFSLAVGALSYLFYAEMRDFWINAVMSLP